MTVQRLIELLSRFDPTKEVRVADSPEANLEIRSVYEGHRDLVWIDAIEERRL